jgi:hypothetical protein
MMKSILHVCRAEQYREGMGPALVPTSSTPVQLELGPPFKKIRFGEPKPEVQQPLRIDTRVSTAVKINCTELLLLDRAAEGKEEMWQRLELKECIDWTARDSH